MRSGAAEDETPTIHCREVSASGDECAPARPARIPSANAQKLLRVRA